jgi:hypothetical protein
LNQGGGWDSNGWSIFLYEGNLRIELQNNETNKKTVVDNPFSGFNQWHHVAITWSKNPGALNVYYDGKLLPKNGTFESEVPLISAPCLNIGRNERNGMPFTGFIKHVRLWSKALTAAEVAQQAKKSLPELQISVPKDAAEDKPTKKEEYVVGYWSLLESQGNEVKSKPNKPNLVGIIKDNARWKYEVEDVAVQPIPDPVTREWAGRKMTWYLTFYKFNL